MRRHSAIAILALILLNYLYAKEKTVNSPISDIPIAINQVSDSSALPVISVPAGFYEDSFTVVITYGETGNSVKYTLDGSDPNNSQSAFMGISPVNVLIHPDSLSGRGKTPAVVLRASGNEPGIEPNWPVSCTYIFPDKVKTQSY